MATGWRQLAERYYDGRPFQGDYYRFQTARINGANYSGALEFGVNDEGLYLVPMILFRAFHKPVFIPWYDIRAKPHKAFLYSGFQLTVQSQKKFKISFYKKTFEKMKTHIIEDAV